MSMRRVLLFIPLVICIVLGFLFVKGLSLNPTELPSAKIGKPFPAFSLATIRNANEVLTEASLTGAVRLVNVWATWCPTCKQEHSFLNKLAQTEGVEIIGINYKDQRSKASQWLKRYRDPYIFNLYDEQGSLGLDLGVYGAPETYIVDAQAIIRYRHVGEVNARVWVDIKAKMQALGWSPKKS
ncbi:MAG: cytochrome C biogenesis protein CcmG [Osedax symbiont Rs2]|nr:MAG: cytochrome C biogenesis protein CcmG [Osedax symbiont Rs1]EPJ53367.1 MAG: cytochrome C biogenesis protein CcmG [Osedax symbiont Rs2]